MRNSILFISPLPPPHGGIATWTNKIFEYGLPNTQLNLVDTKIRGKRNIFDKTFFSFSEIVRSCKIFGSLIYQLLLNRPKLIHLNSSLSSHGIFRDLFCALLGKLFFIPIVSHYHGNLPDFQGQRFRGLSAVGLRLLMHITTMNIVTNQSSFEIAKKIVSHSKKISINLLPNFIEDDIFTNKIFSKNMNMNRRAIFAGGITTGKGCLEILNVAKKMPEIEFHLIGKMHDDVKKIFTNLPSNIFLHGILQHDALIVEMLRSDFLLFPSYSEGFPLTVLEAMSVGLPVIATSVGAIPEMIDEGRGGFLVQPKNVDALIEAINKLFINESLCSEMGKYNREKSYCNYRYSIVVKKLLTIYEKIGMK